MANYNTARLGQFTTAAYNVRIYNRDDNERVLDFSTDGKKNCLATRGQETNQNGTRWGRFWCRFSFVRFILSPFVVIGTFQARPICGITLMKERRRKRSITSLVVIASKTDNKNGAKMFVLGVHGWEPKCLTPAMFFVFPKLINVNKSFSKFIRFAFATVN